MKFFTAEDTDIVAECSCAISNSGASEFRFQRIPHVGWYWLCSTTSASPAGAIPNRPTA